MIYRSRSLLLACQTAALALLTACAGDPPAAAHASAQPALTLAAFTPESAPPVAEPAVAPSIEPIAPTAEPAALAAIAPDAPAVPAAPATPALADGPVAPAALASSSATTPRRPALPPHPALGGHSGRDSDMLALYIQANDSNADGIITPEELERVRHAHFCLADTNQDGALSIQEYLREFEERLDAVIALDTQRIEALTGLRFDALADGQRHIDRAHFNQASDRIWAAWASGKLPDKLPTQPPGGKASTQTTTPSEAAPPFQLEMPSTHTKAGLLALYDRNRDGKLTRDELRLGRDEQFRRADANGDDRLSQGEYETEFRLRLGEQAQAFKTRKMSRARMRFGVIDANRNDRIDWSEYRATGQRVFKHADRNADGQVDATDAIDTTPATPAKPRARNPFEAGVRTDLGVPLDTGRPAAQAAPTAAAP